MPPELAKSLKDYEGITRSLSKFLGLLALFASLMSLNHMAPKKIHGHA